MIYNILSRDVFIRSSKKDLEKRQFTLHMTYFAEEPDNFPRVKPLLVFKAQPSGYDEEDSDWEGDVEYAPHLDPNERDDYDDRVFVIYSKKKLIWVDSNVNGISRKFLKSLEMIIFYFNLMVTNQW